MTHSLMGAWGGARLEKARTRGTTEVPSGGFQAFTALPSNIGALEACMRFADGTYSLVALSGPSGWGKTHILTAVTEQLRESAAGPTECLSAVDWALSVGRYDNCENLVLDDVQDVFTHPRARHRLRQALDLRVRTRRRTLLAWTTPESSGKVRSLLPGGRNWSFCEIREPTIDERELVARQIAASINVQLSVPVSRLIARHLHGNARSILGAVQRLRLAKTDWTRPRDVIPACGVLGPYILGHEGWDPRDHVHEAVNRVFAGRASCLKAVDVSCYLMLDEMGLCESEVASFLDVSPSTAYGKCRLVRSSLGDDLAACLVDACRNAVLCGFEEG